MLLLFMIALLGVAFGDDLDRIINVLNSEDIATCEERVDLAIVIIRRCVYTSRFDGWASVGFKEQCDCITDLVQRVDAVLKVLDESCWERTRFQRQFVSGDPFERRGYAPCNTWGKASLGGCVSGICADGVSIPLAPFYAASVVQSRLEQLSPTTTSTSPGTPVPTPAPVEPEEPEYPDDEIQADLEETRNFDSDAFIAKVCFHCEDSYNGDFVQVVGTYDALLNSQVVYDVNGNLYVLATLTKDFLDATLEKTEGTKDCMTVIVSQKGSLPGVLACESNRCDLSRSANRRVWLDSETDHLDLFFTNAKGRGNNIAETRDSATDLNPKLVDDDEPLELGDVCADYIGEQRQDSDSTSAHTIALSFAVVFIVSLFQL